ncbi:MAG: glycosyltransferase family 2 protein [Erysipelotrichaceae bacterium]|nr:glycosyltransferase family 2 protein [Erysipelotrichaceae bacterium]
MVKILMPVYNGEKYLKEQLDSLIRQDFSDWHLTISDDGSDDSSKRIIEEYEAEYPERISIHESGKRFGDAKDHYLHLLENCKAEYIMFCDQDDVWKKNKISLTYKKMKEEEEKDKPCLIFTDLIPVDEDLKEISPSMMKLQDQDPYDPGFKKLVFRNVITGNTVMINKPLRDLALKFKGSEGIIMHDWWLGIVAAGFGKIAYIDMATVLYRQHGHNQIGAKDTKSVSYISGRLNDLDSVKESVIKRKKQAGLFLETYADRLSDEDRAFLEGLSKERSGLPFYMHYSKYIHGLFRLMGMIVYG